MKKTIFIIGILLNISIINAQNVTDALRYSYILQGGTSRSNAMGNSFGAIGGDATSLYFNPAGLGAYRSSELTITPGFEINKSESDFLNKKYSDFDFGLNINNLAVVLSIPNDGECDFFNFGVSYNKLNNFRENIFIKGINNKNSVTDWFASKANGYTWQELDNENNDIESFYGSPAWWTYLINPINYTDDNTFYSSMFNKYGQEQTQRIYRNGYQGEYNISMGLNFQNFLLFGLSFGLQTIKFEEIKNLIEIDINNIIKDFNRLDYREYLQTKGIGVNAKMGLICNPIDWLKLGVSVHTPTIYGMQDEWWTTIRSDIDSIFDEQGKQVKIHEITSPNGYYEYNFVSPFRANASAGFVIQNFALINLDYELVTYNSTKLKSSKYDDYTFEDENSSIRENLVTSHNVKLGAEYRLLPMLCLRAGVGYYGSPYKHNKKGFVMNYSGGLGFKLGKYTFLDAAYSYFSGNENYYIYGDQEIESPLAKIAKKRNRVTFTLSFKF